MLRKLLHPIITAILVGPRAELPISALKGDEAIRMARRNARRLKGARALATTILSDVE